MGLWERLFASDLRRAVSAEAKGDFDEAATRYAQAGHRPGAVRMHLRRADRARDLAAELDALRAALHWAGDDDALRQAPAARLGGRLLTDLERAGITTQRDRDKAREAIDLLTLGGDYQRAGDALRALGDHAAAAHVYSLGGLVEELEAALAHDDVRSERARTEANAFANYQTQLRLGHRDDARAELATCLAHASEPAHYQRLLAELDTARITGGRLELGRGAEPPVVVCALPHVTLGRDPLCEFPLRASGISRAHGRLELADDGDPTTPAFRLRDAGSRNGTRLDGLPVAGVIALPAQAEIDLGDDCTLALVVDEHAPWAHLTVRQGLDRGRQLVLTRPGAKVALTTFGLPAELVFADGRPYLVATAPLTFNDEPLGRELRVQLIRGDRLGHAGQTYEVR